MSPLSESWDFYEKELINPITTEKTLRQKKNCFYLGAMSVIHRLKIAIDNDFCKTNIYNIINEINNECHQHFEISKDD